MTVGVNQIFDCLEANMSVNQHDVEDLIRAQRAKSSSIELSHLLIDVDTTLERLYGGYHADWLAGGEWSHLHSYMMSLLKTCEELSLCLIFCFDGTLYRYGQSQWFQEQIQQRKKVNQIFKHLKQNKSGLPRRQFWLPPPAFQVCLRTILRELNSPHLLMYQTVGYGTGEHQEQIKTYARQYDQSLLGIVSSDIEFLLPTTIDQINTSSMRYFCSKHLKLSLKGKLTVMEITLHQLKEKFSLNDQQFSLLLTLLGNHMLSGNDLAQFHNDLLREQDLTTRTSLKSNGTLSPPAIDSSLSEIKSDVCSPDHHTLDTNEDQQQTSPVSFPSQSRSHGNNFPVNFTADQLIPRLADYIRKRNPENELDLNSIVNQVFKHLTDDAARQVKAQSLNDSYEYYSKAMINSQSAIDPVQSSDRSTTSHSYSQILANKSDDNAILENCIGVNKEVARTAFHRHKQGLMTPWIFQCLYRHEITFSVTIEPEMCKTIPNVCEFYRPIRKHLYAILFDRHTIVREQVYNSEHSSFLTEVLPEPLPMKYTIEQLWFGTKPDEDRQIRLKTFLQSLNYCDLPRIHSVSHEYLLLTCILRYIYMEFFRYSSTSAVLHTYELMALIAQAVFLAELPSKTLLHQYTHAQIPNYETRLVQLAQLFTRGYETIMFANEVCGAPIHPKYCSLSHFFNGKLFYQKYTQAQHYQQSPDLMTILCDGNVHCAQTGCLLLDVILDRSSANDAHHTPMQQQYQYSAVPHQQRILKNSSRHVRAQTLLANSTRAPMRTNYKPSTNSELNHQQQTPVANYRQLQPPPPPVRQAGYVRNDAMKANNFATPFNTKVQQQSTKVRTHTPINGNSIPLSQQQQQPPYSVLNEQWNGTLAPTVHLNMQHIPVQHKQPMTNNFLNPLDEQFLHLQIHPSSVATTPTSISYSHSTPTVHSHIPMVPYNHLHLPPTYLFPNGLTFYQQSSSPAVSFPQPLTTPYHSSQMIPNQQPHAPIAPQRTVNFTTVPSNPPNNNSNLNAYQQRLSPTHEMNVQVLQQQRMMDQQTPISLHRQMNRLPQYDIHRSVPMQNYLHHPSMFIEQQQRPHGL